MLYVYYFPLVLRIAAAIILYHLHGWWGVSLVFLFGFGPVFELTWKEE